MKNPDKFKDEKTQLTEADRYKASAEAHKQELKSSWKTFWGTGAFVLAALSVFFIICIAWFAMNDQVNSNTGAVSAQQDIVRIASKGVRQTAESKMSGWNLAEGTYKTIDNEDYYYTEGGEIAWRLAEDYSVMPGANGSIDFYIIPNHDGAQTITLYMGLAGYKKGRDAEGKEIVESVNDGTLNALLNGHILLFNNKDENGFYSDWLFNVNEGGIINNTIKVEIPPEWEKDKPYQCTVYWIWPKRYENMISHRLDSNDIFAEDSNEIAEFQSFIDRQSNTSTQIEGTSYAYSYIFLWNHWPLEASSDCSKAYNLADEYIGTNADYLYLTIRTASQVEMNAGEGENSE